MLSHLKKNELVDIVLDSGLSFEDQINSLCKKASQKQNSLARIAQYMCPKNRKTVMKAFLISQFRFCSLIWMFHNRGLNNKINSLHEKALKITDGIHLHFKTCSEKTTQLLSIIGI